MAVEISSSTVSACGSKEEGSEECCGSGVGGVDVDVEYVGGRREVNGGGCCCGGVWGHWVGVCRC